MSADPENHPLSFLQFPLFEAVPTSLPPLNTQSSLARYLSRKELQKVPLEETPDYVLDKSSKPLMASWIHARKLHEWSPKSSTDSQVCIGHDKNYGHHPQIHPNYFVHKSHQSHEEFHAEMAYYRKIIEAEEKIGIISPLSPSPVIHHNDENGPLYDDERGTKPKREPEVDLSVTPINTAVTNMMAPISPVHDMHSPSLISCDRLEAMKTAQQPPPPPPTQKSKSTQLQSYSRKLENMPNKEKTKHKKSSSEEQSKQIEKLPSINERKIIGLCSDSNPVFLSPAVCSRLGLQPYNTELRVGSSSK